MMKKSLRSVVGIENRIYKLAGEIFGFNFSEYMSMKKRVLLGVIVNPYKRKFEYLFGEFPDGFLTTINKQFHDAVAGYRVDVGAHFLELGVNADVFLLNINNLSDSKEEIDSLLIHELCHMVIDSNYLDKAKIIVSEKDRYHGDKLHKRTDINNEHITKHTIRFCNLLSAASIIAAIRYPVFNDRWGCINSAMRYDLKENLRR